MGNLRITGALRCYAHLVLRSVLLALVVAGSCRPENFVYTTAGDLPSLKRILERDDIGGAQVVYNWKRLEPAKDRYDFRGIEEDLALTESLGKKLFIQVQDRFFAPEHRNVPRYLLEEAEYGGGLVRQIDNPGEGRPQESGWVARQWDPRVRQRFQRLLTAMAERFDGRIYGLNLPETAIGVDVEKPPAGFTCGGYFDAELENVAHARRVFRRSHVVQYVNFWPCEWNNDRSYMARTFEFAAKNGIGLGGPDIVPWRPGQMKNSYPFFAKFKGRLPLVAMAVQEPTLTYTNPKTGKPFTREEFEQFGREYLGVHIIFWAASAPWLSR